MAWEKTALALLTVRKLNSLADGSRLDISGRDETIHGEAGDIERNLLDAPRLLHASLGVAHSHLTETEKGHSRPPGMCDHYTLYWAVILDERADGSLPVNRVAPGC
jgi:hypothetical protein